VLVQVPPSHESTVQGFLSSQSGLMLHVHAVVEAWQAPATHLSPVVQALPSSQAALLAVLTQPTPGKQASSVQGLPSSHTTALPGEQLPSAQRSPWVQALPSLQVAPTAKLTAHLPSTQVLTVQGFLSVQSAALLQLQLGVPMHTPAAQVSPLLQASPSSQVAAAGRNTQLPDLGSQLSAVQGLLSLQAAVAVPGLQAPAAQVSPWVQALPSEHAPLLSLWAQAPCGSQVSSVQGLPSSHWAGVQPLAPSPACAASAASLVVRLLSPWF